MYVGLAIAGLIFFFFIGFLILIKLRRLKRHLSSEVVFLELTPPPTPHSTLRATEEFFAVLNQVLKLRSWRDVVSGRKTSIALEVVSTQAEGIRYLIRLPRHDYAIFLHNLAALAPTVTAEEVTDYLQDPVANQLDYVIDLKQTGPKSYALKYSHAEAIYDPIAYIINAISGLHDEEMIAVQLVLTPASDWQVATDPTKQTDTHMHADIVAATLHKQSQPQFHTSVRIFIRTTSPERYRQKRKGVISALAAFSYEGYQSLQPRLDVPKLTQRCWLYAFYNRVPPVWIRYATILATSELAALYHFPYGTAIHTEDLQLQQEAALPVPLSVKKQVPAFDVVLGSNTYRGRTTPIGLTISERQRHVFVVGGTGNGKSTLLQHAIVQDMRAGKGLAVIDPHGDLVETVLRYVPEGRIDDVVYFNPSDLRFPIGLNVLELPLGLQGDELLKEKDLVTESIVSMFRKIFSSSDAGGHRIEYILRNTVQTALTLDESTLFTVYELLNNSAFRKRVVSKLEHPDLKLFWNEFHKAGSYQQAGMALGITAKIGRFLFSASARRILEQPRSSINFDELMQQGKILLCNVSKGQLGEDTAELFGIMILAKLQLAALRRARLSPEARRPFYVYVDEFQNFATPSFTQLLSEARKYQLFLTMAEQSTAQQHDPRMTDIMLANVGTVIAFRTGSRHDEELLQPLFAPQVLPGTLSRLPAYNFYMRIAALQAQPPFSGMTLLLDTPGDHMLARLVIQASRMKYGRRTIPADETTSTVTLALVVNWPLRHGST